jgi:hypothetical protein
MFIFSERFSLRVWSRLLGIEKPLKDFIEAIAAGSAVKLPEAQPDA